MTYEMTHERLNGYTVVYLDENGDYIYDPE